MKSGVTKFFIKINIKYNFFFAKIINSFDSLGGRVFYIRAFDARARVTYRDSSPFKDLKKG